MAAAKKKVGVLKSISKYGLALPVGIGNLITKGISKITGKTYGKTTLEEASQTKFGRALGVGIAGIAVALAAVVSPTSTIKAVKAITPKTAIGKTIGLITAGAVVASPRVATAVIEAPIGLIQTGQKIGEQVEAMPGSVTEGRGKYTLLGLGAAALAGAGVATAATLLLTKKEEIISNIPQLPALGSNAIEKETPVGSSLTGVPLTPETTTIQTGKRKRRKAKAAILNPINNNVRISILNRVVGSQTRNVRYLKIPAYA